MSPDARVERLTAEQIAAERVKLSAWDWVTSDTVLVHVRISTVRALLNAAERMHRLHVLARDLQGDLREWYSQEYEEMEEPPATCEGARRTRDLLDEAERVLSDAPNPAVALPPDTLTMSDNMLRAARERVEALERALENTADALEVFAGIAPILRADAAWEAAVGRARAALSASAHTPQGEQ